MNSILRLSIAFAVVVITISSQAYDIYSNTNAAGDLNYNLSSGTTQIGDEIVPAGGGFLSHIDIQYYLSNSDGDEYVQLWLYQNDGDPVVLGNRTAYEPFTALFTSSLFNIGSSGDTVRATLNYDAGSDFTANSIFISGTLNLTLAIQFTGIEAGEDAGVFLYDYPTVGDNYSSYWEYDGSSWVLSTNSLTPNGFVDFGMRIEAVPEPTAFSLVLMGGLALFGARRFSVRK